MDSETASSSQTKSTPSSNIPSEGWCQLQDTVSLLRLAMAQIESSRTDSSKSIERLMHCFVSITEQSAAISNACQSLTADQLEAQKDQIASQAAAVNTEVSNAVIALQYHDRLSQKLEHVTSGLNKLGELIDDNQRRQSYDEWLKLQSEIKNNYTLDCERLLFDLIMSGSSLGEALQRYHDDYDQLYGDEATAGQQEEEIEFF